MQTELRFIDTGAEHDLDRLCGELTDWMPIHLCRIDEQARSVTFHVSSANVWSHHRVSLLSFLDHWSDLLQDMRDSGVRLRVAVRFARHEKLSPLRHLDAELLDRLARNEVVLDISQ